MIFIKKLFNILFKYKFYRFYIFSYFIFKNLTERSDIKFFKENIKEGDTVVDGGANIGFYTSLFSKLVGKSGLVIAFEPDDVNFNILSSRIGNKDNVLLVNAALSNSSGDLSMYVSEALNVDHQTYDSGENRRVKKVKSFSLDDYLIQNKIQIPNLIKTDLQGYDAIAIRGMRDTIKNAKSIILISEVWPSAMRKVAIDLNEWFKEMEDNKLNFIIPNLPKNIDKDFYFSIVFRKDEMSY